MGGNFQFLLEKKNLVNLVILIILVIGLPIAINLARQQQILRSRAANVPIEIIDGDCVEERDGKKVLICNEVPLKLISPIGGVMGEPSTFSPAPRASNRASSSPVASISTACQSSLKTVDGKPIVNSKNFSSIQLAFDCFKEASTGGGAVYIPAGNYLIPEKLRVYSNMTVFGDGIDLTVISLTGSKNDAGMSNDSSRGQSNIVIRDLTLKGPNNKGTNCCMGLELENITNGFVINVATDNWGVDGIYLGYKSVSGVLKGVNNVRISNCRANNNDRNGISLTQGSGVVIDNCTLENNNADPEKRASAIDLEPDSGGDTSNNKILSNSLSSNKGNGIGLGPNPNEPDPKGRLFANAVCFNKVNNNDFAGIVDYPGTTYIENSGNDPVPKNSGSANACNIPAALNTLPPVPPKPIAEAETGSSFKAFLGFLGSLVEIVSACSSDEECGGTNYCDKHNSEDGTGECKSQGTVADESDGREGSSTNPNNTNNKKDKTTKTKKNATPTPVPTTVVQTTASPSAATTPRASTAQIQTAAPTPLPTYTVWFKVAESESGLRDAEEISYDEEPIIFNYLLENEEPGLKQIWVEFKNSENRIFKKSVLIELVEEDPAIEEVSCKLDIQEKGVVFDIKGQRFGENNNGKVFLGEKDLTILDWTAGEVSAILENLGITKIGEEKFSLKLIRGDGQESDIIPCTIGLTQLALGTDLFCREKGGQEEKNVEVTFIDADGKKQSELVSINKDGVVVGLETKLQTGKKYLVSVKTPTGLRRNAVFTASSGTAVARSSEEDNFLIPIGDIYTPGGGDGAINSADRLELTKQWIVTNNPNLSGDFNKDSRVNSIDWGCMRHNFGLTDEVLPQKVEETTEE